MTDWTQPTGSTGTMMIRDTGTNVEFWLKAGSATFAYDMPWGYTINGGTNHSQKFRFESGGAWQKVASFNITYDQNVTFWLGDTGTSGLGGPTSFTHFIDRASAPSPPSTPAISNITYNSCYATFSDGASNGATITQKQLGYGTSPSAPQFSFNCGNGATIGNLASGTTWYVWAREYNAKGWSAWSGRAQFTTHRVPDAPSAPSASNITQVSCNLTFSQNYNGGSAVNNSQFGWSFSPDGDPTTTFPGVGGNCYGLIPGKTYYFRVRVANYVGWSPWSAATAVKTIPGALVKVGTVWKAAVPYVNVQGVWKVARPWGKAAGVWKEST